MLAFVLLALCMFPAVKARTSNNEQKAGQILGAGGVKGGLIVHIGCGDGKLTAALRANNSDARDALGGYLVHGLETNAEKVNQARRYIRSLGEYGKVSIDWYDGKRLPYIDNLVNLVVAEDIGDVPMDEVMRVLAPGCVALIGGKKTVKPRPDNTDEWTHFLYDASGNAVGHDDIVGPPRYAQWIAGPRHTRSHEHTPSINALVSSGGRIFYIADEGPISSVLRDAQWHLVARDAYNGILLWKRAFNPWYPHICNWGYAPPQLQRKLVAVGDRIYVTLGFHAPLSVVDAATGETLKVYEETEGTEEIVYHKGIILLVVRSVTDERVAELGKLANLEKVKKSPLYVRETAQPLFDRFRSLEGKAKKAVLALNADTGRLLWKKAGPDTSGLRAVSLCAVSEQVFYQKGKNVVCLNLRTGREKWSVSASPLRVVCETSVICSNGQSVTALSGETGKVLWSQPGLLTDIRDAFIINGSLWLGGFKPCEGKRGPSWGPYFVTQRHLATGKVLMHIEPSGPGHHHRCWRNKATERYILGGRRGVEYIDLETGDVLWHSWVRGVCKYGVMPCNGLLYAPPHSCGCYISAKLTGFYALSSKRQNSEDRSQRSERLEKGPAYNNTREARGETRYEWPTYRGDVQRSGFTRRSVPAELHRAWQVDVGGELTSPTAAGGKVFVASVEGHRVCAIDADSGRSAWEFTAGARVDSPPSIYANRAIFGCRDGYVYSLRTSDGSLAWRLQAARTERLITVCGQLESASPLHGSVLVQDGLVSFTSGRSSYLDGGIDFYRLEAQTGKILSMTRVYSPDPETGKQPEQYGPANMPGALGDILTSDDQYVYLRDMIFDKDGGSQPKGNPHLFTLTGFLDDSWPHRSYWIFGTHCSVSGGCSRRDKGLIYGRLLAFDESIIYGYGRANVHWSNQLQDGAYRLFAVKRGDGTAHWTKTLPIQVRAMALADKVLFVAGSRGVGGNVPAGRKEGSVFLLMAISASDGAELAQYRLDSSPVLDGMAAAYGRLYLSLKNGQLLCMSALGRLRAESK